MSSADARVSALFLQIKHDKAMAARLIRDLRDIRAEMKATEKAVGGTTGFDALRRSIVGVDKEVERSIGLFERYRKVADNAATSALNANSAAGSSGGRGSARGFGNVQRLSRLAANVPQLQGIAGGFNVADDIGDAVRTLANMGPVALAGAAGAGALTLAIVAMTDQNQKAAEAARLAIDAQLDYFGLIARGSQESLQAQRDAKRTEVAIARARAEQSQRILQDLIGGIIGEHGGFGFELAALSATLNIGAGELKSARDAANENTAALATLESELGTLERALDSETIAKRASKQAAEELKQAELDLVAARQSNLDRQIENEIRILSSVPQSTKALNDRLDAINREQEVNRAYLNTVGISQAETERLNQKLRDLSTEESLLSITLRPLVAEIEAQAAITQTLADKEKRLAADRQRSAELAAKLGDEIRELRDKDAALAADSAAKIAELASDLNDKLGEALRDQQKALAAAEQDAAQERSDAIAQANKDELKAEVEHRRNLQQIEQQFNRSAEQAIQDRNAVALDAAQTARDDALADENQANEDRRKDINDNLEKTNADINRKLIEQRNNAIARYNEQVRIANDANQKAIAAERAKAAAEIAANQVRISQLQTQQQAANAAALNMAKEGSLQLLAVERDLWAQRAAIAAGGGSVPGGNKGKVPKFDSGPPAFINRRMLASLSPGDVVIPPGNRGMGGINITVNGARKSRLQAANEVREQVLKIWDEVAT